MRRVLVLLALGSNPRLCFVATQIHQPIARHIFNKPRLELLVLAGCLVGYDIPHAKY